MIHLQIAEPYQSLVESDRLLKAAEAALQHQAAPAETDLTLVITDNEQLQALNRQFRDQDTSTDVLAFPSGDEDPQTGEAYLGDVVISYPQARSQAEAGGHPVEDELQLLIVHGVLHLLGYDHAAEDEKARMWAAQTEILTPLGCRAIP